MAVQSSGAFVDDRGANEHQLLELDIDGLVVGPQRLAEVAVDVAAFDKCLGVPERGTGELWSDLHPTSMHA